MPSIDAMAPSRFLKKAHLEKPRLGTIREIRTENVAPDNRAPEIKPVVYFREFQEGVPVGSRQRDQLKSICGTDDIEGMIGKAVVLYVDPAVEYGGKMVGGIRFRAPKQRPPAQGIPAASPAPAAPPPPSRQYPWEAEPDALPEDGYADDTTCLDDEEPPF